MAELFAALSRAIEGSAPVALGASFVWGILSVILSPCHLAGIPLIVAYVGGRAGLTVRRAFWISSLFALGVLGSIGLIGLLTAWVGRILGSIGPWANYGVAVVLFVVGLHLLDVIPLPIFSPPDATRVRGKGFTAAFVLGFVFGVALGPCTFAYMAPVLAVSFKVAGTAPLLAAGLLLAYGVGHSAVLAAAGTSARAVQEYLRWTEGSTGLKFLRRACGVLVILGGLYLIASAR